ncbi:MAG TPA: omptin family outer membrane protease [Treponemataceae bacterium]|nr:omptin family outer membrane protease [Treponemataceae bacterium]
MRRNYTTDAVREPKFEKQRTKHISKQIRMCIFFLGTTLCSFPLFSSPLFNIPLPQFSLSPFTEIVYGESFEYVYTSDKILSELVWDMKPLYFLGLEAGLEWKKGLSLNVEASFGLPMVTGLMEDSDWFNLFQDIDTGKTHFSRHAAKLEYATVLSCSAGWIFSTKDKNTGVVTFTPSIGYKYFSWKWNAVDGYIQHNSAIGGIYTEWEESQTKVHAYGVGISYQQQFYIPTIGVSSSFSPNNKIKTELGITFSPLVYSYNIDHHFYPTSGHDYRESTMWTEYHDILTDGIFFEPSIAVTWSVSNKVCLFFNARKTLISSLRGTTGEIKSGSSYVSWTYKEDGNGSGTALNTTNFRLGCVLLYK